MTGASEEKRALIDRLRADRNLTDEEFRKLIESEEPDTELFEAADEVRQSIYDKDVYTRGIVEFTNYCKNNCYYCGIRRDNRDVERYRLTEEQILQSCEAGSRMGYRTFVLQGGEDPYFTDEKICSLVSKIKEAHPDCAVTLSIGEKSRESYQKYFDAGADRYLLRHETADEEHYRKLHPKEMNLSNRMRCLFDLKEIGYQTGAGFMVGAPYQTTETLIKDLRFLQKLDPDMIGIGPFIHHADTPFRDYENGTLDMTLRFLAILRLMFPDALIPATTALGTIDPKGREKGFKAGANVVMPNVTPSEVRENYLLYDEKVSVKEDLYQCGDDLQGRASDAGYRMVSERGDRIFVQGQK